MSGDACKLYIHSAVQLSLLTPEGSLVGSPGSSEWAAPSVCCHSRVDRQEFMPLQEAMQQELQGLER